METKYEEYLRKKREYDIFTDSNQKKIQSLERKIDFYHTEAERIEYNLDYCDEIIKELSDEFKNQMTFTGADFTFLFLAVGMQLIRQYATRFTERTSHDVSEVESKEWGYLRH